MSTYSTVVAGFAVILAGITVVEVLGRAGRAPFRPAGDVLSLALATRAGRWLVAGAWLWLGFHFLAR
jgi:hypothetical protein